MTHSNQFVAAIKVNGKILREQGATVTLPFGAEYSILLKNLKSVRALVQVSIDGESVTDSIKLILQPNSEIDLERAICQGNLVVGNRFKFIQRTADIENHRGIKSGDGLVRIEFWAEKPDRPISLVQTPFNDYTKIYNTPAEVPNLNSNHYQSQSTNADFPYRETSLLRSVGSLKTGMVSAQSMNTQANSVNAVNALNDVGITVPGSHSNQQFTFGGWFPTESQSTVIVFELRGQVGSDRVTEPLTTQCKLNCVTCNKSNKSSSKFCCACGTSLQIL